MAFVDECTVFLTAGRGGNGSASIHSEPYKPRGGPDGGNGGDGGSIVFEVSRGVHDLSWLADHPHQKAPGGKPGRSAKREGASGKDLVIPVPEGTVVMDDRGLIADLVGEGSRAIVAAGGRGGRGNTAFAGPRNRVPRTAEPGEDGEERRSGWSCEPWPTWAWWGLPNAGKSTLLARLTAAKPKVANYPFTTLTPNLGVAGDDVDRFVVADIPGLVEGASEGKGLGHRFLRHIVRCRALVLVVDLATDDPAADLATLRAELAAYDPELARAARRSWWARRPTSWMTPGSAIAALGPDALAGVGDDRRRDRGGAADRSASWRRRAKPRNPDSKPYVVLRPGKPRFTVSREDERSVARPGPQRRTLGVGGRPGRRARRRAAAAPPREGRCRDASSPHWARGRATRSPSWTASSNSCPTSTGETDRRSGGEA